MPESALTSPFSSHYRRAHCRGPLGPSAMPTAPQDLVRRRKGCMCPVSLENMLAMQHVHPSQAGRTPLEFSVLLTSLSCLHMASEARGSLPDHQGTHLLLGTYSKKDSKGRWCTHIWHKQHSTHTPGGEINGPRTPSLDTLPEGFMILGSEDEKTWNCLPRKLPHTCRTDSVTCVPLLMSCHLQRSSMNRQWVIPQLNCQ